MMEAQLVMQQEDFDKVLAIIQKLVRDANAKGVFVVDKAGQLVGEAGEMEGIDSTSLASLTAGCVAATGGLAKIVGEEEFPIHFHQGQSDNLHMTLVGDRMILVVVFDERSSLWHTGHQRRLNVGSECSSRSSFCATNHRSRQGTHITWPSAEQPTTLPTCLTPWQRTSCRLQP